MNKLPMGTAGFRIFDSVPPDNGKRAGRFMSVLPARETRGFVDDKVAF